MPRNNDGFTLLEVMVALIIFSMLAITLSSASSSRIDGHIHIEHKLLANILAESEIAELRNNPWPSIIDNEKTLTAANRQWLLKTKVAIKADVLPGLNIPVKEVDVSVRLADKPDDVIQTLTALIGKDD
jgi:general secretion pathway protein I